MLSTGMSPAAGIEGLTNLKSAQKLAEQAVLSDDVLKHSKSVVVRCGQHLHHRSAVKQQLIYI